MVSKVVMTYLSPVSRLAFLWDAAALFIVELCFVGLLTVNSSPCARSFFVMKHIKSTVSESVLLFSSTLIFFWEV